MWIAAPPEVHSTLLSSGPGPGALLAAAGAWNSLSAEYSAIAAELTALVAQVQADAWQGPSADSFAAANAPFAAWLTQAGANSAAAAAQHETAATAYTAALAAMPTVPELAANHVAHGVLTATNFFGINTIPIALNEADYARMWIQAATTMSTYQSVVGSAVASTPQTGPAPVIVKSDTAAGPAATLPPNPPYLVTPLDDLVAWLLQQNGIIWDPGNYTLNGVPYSVFNPINIFTAPPIDVLLNYLEILQGLEQFVEVLFTNPLQAIFQFLPALLAAHILIPVYLTAPFLPLLSSLSSVAAIAAVVGAIPFDVSGLSALDPVAVPAAVALAPPVHAGSLAVAAVSAAPTPAPAPAAATASGTAPSAPTPSAPPAPPPGGGFGLPYLIGFGGGPGIGFDFGGKNSASASGRLQAPAESAAVADAAAAKRRARRKQQRQARQDDYADAFMDVGVDPDWTAPPGDQPTASSEGGAGPLGFAGTVHKAAAGQAAGLATLPSDDFGGGPTLPLLPSAWSHQATDSGPERD